MSLKKFLAIMLAVIMVVGLAACGGTTSSSSTGGETTSPASQSEDTTESKEETPAVAPGDAPTLVWWLIGNTPPNLDEGMKQINDYTAEKYGVKLDIRVVGWGEWEKKMIQIINTSDPFDIMFINGVKYGNFVSQNAFLDISELVEKETPELFNFIPELVWDGARINGKIYSVPTYKDSSLLQMWVFDDEYVQKTNFDLETVKDFKDLDPFFQAVKAEDPNLYPLRQVQAEGFNGWTVKYDGMTLGLRPLGVRYDDKERKVVSVLEQEENMETLRLLHKWYNEGIINPDAPTLQDGPKDRIMFPAQGFAGAEVLWQIDAGVEKYDPVEMFGPIYTTDTIQGSLNAISANSKYPAEALKLLQAVNTDQKLRDYLGYGVEGVDFEYTTESKNVVKKLNESWGIGNYAIGTFFNMAVVEGTPEDQWDQVKAQNERAFASTILGFAFDQTPVATEIANVQTTWDKYKYELENGALDPDAMVPVIVEELNASGMTVIMEEAQRQIDAFFAE